GAEDLDEGVGLGDSVEDTDEADGARDVEAQTLVTVGVRGVNMAFARIGGGGVGVRLQVSFGGAEDYLDARGFHLVRTCGYLGVGGVGVRLRVSFGGREDELDALGPGVDGPLGALEVEHEGEELDAVGFVRGEAAQQFVGVGHLRDLLRVDEGTDLDVPQSRGDELFGQRDLGLGGHDRLLDLETVAQSGVEDVDGVRPDHGTPSHMFPKNGTLLASSRLCEGSLSLYSALIS